MCFRFPLLLILLASLAFGPVRLSAACGGTMEVKGCGGCCMEMTCCVAGKSAPEQTPASVAPTVPDMKLLSLVAFLVSGFIEFPPEERPTFTRQHAACMPVQPRLELTCILLI